MKNENGKNKRRSPENAIDCILIPKGEAPSTQKSLAKLCRDLRISPKIMVKALERLVDKGILRAETVAMGDDMVAQVYFVTEQPRFSTSAKDREGEEGRS